MLYHTRKDVHAICLKSGDFDLNLNYPYRGDVIAHIITKREQTFTARHLVFDPGQPLPEDLAGHRLAYLHDPEHNYYCFRRGRWVLLIRAQYVTPERTPDV